MTTMTIAPIHNNYPNNFGCYAEQALCYALTGEIRTHDKVPFYMGSDIPESGMSVKSSGFTLASGRINVGDTFDEKIADFTSRVHSTSFAYVTQSLKVYIMTLDEFVEFMYAFCSLERDSKKNGGLLKIHCRKESAKMLAWFEAHVA